MLNIFGIHNYNSINAIKNFPDKSVNRLIVDPPFGIDFGNNESQYNRIKENVASGYVDIPSNEYQEWCDEWISEIYRVLTDDGTGIIFSGWSNEHKIRNALDKAGFTTINVCIWKYQFGVYTKKKFVTSHYSIIFFVKNPKKYFFNKVDKYPEDVMRVMSKGNIKNQINDLKVIMRDFDGNDFISFKKKMIHKMNVFLRKVDESDLIILKPEDKSDVVVFNRIYKKGGEKVPTSLPESIINYFIPYITKEDDIILDLFTGSGKILTSCIKQGRKNVIGFEIANDIYEIGKQEMIKLNGKSKW